MPLNTDLLTNVLRSIYAHPDAYSQAHWIGSRGLNDENTDFTLSDFEKGCGTTACVAGWTLLHEGYTFAVEFDYSIVDPTRTLPYISAHKTGVTIYPEMIPSTAARALVSGGRPEDQWNRDLINDLFFTMDREVVIANLMFLLDSGGEDAWSQRREKRHGFEFVSHYLRLANQTFGREAS